MEIFCELNMPQMWISYMFLYEAYLMKIAEPDYRNAVKSLVDRVVTTPGKFDTLLQSAMSQNQESIVQGHLIA